MTESVTTRTLIENFLQVSGGGDPAAIAKLYAEQVTWTLAWPEDEFDGQVPWIKHRSTRADVEDHYRTVSEFTVASESTAEVTAMLVDGQDAVIVGVLGQTLRTNGQSYQVAFILYLTVADGLITRHHIVEDNLTIKRAFEAAG